MLFLASTSTSAWIVSLVCNDLSKATGGCNRSLQIYEILADNGWTLELIDHEQFQASSPLITMWGAAKSIKRHGAYLPFCRDSIRAQGRNFVMTTNLLDSYTFVNGIIMEGTGYGALSALAEWKRAGKKVILVPQNIESLAANGNAWTHKGLTVDKRFEHERRWLQMADSIFTIALEESWWLGLHGISSTYLPYFPPVQRRLSLHSIRQRRNPNHAVGWLYVADFNNPPNKIGAKLMLDWLNDISDTPRSLKIVGRGCDWFVRTYASALPDFCEVLGEVDDNRLDSLYCHCTAQLIVHPPTSGMLTRIIDAALAGIPVIGNDMALKNYSSFFDGPSCPVQPSYPLSSVQRLLHEIF